MADSDVRTVPGTNPHPRIVKDDDTVGGVARIIGTRVRVSDVVVAYNYHELTPAEIAEEYPSLTVSDVYVASSYFSDNQGEIRDRPRQESDPLRKRLVGYKRPASIRSGS